METQGLAGRRVPLEIRQCQPDRRNVTITSSLHHASVARLTTAPL